MLLPVLYKGVAEAPWSSYWILPQRHRPVLPDEIDMIPMQGCYSCIDKTAIKVSNQSHEQDANHVQHCVHFDSSTLFIIVPSAMENIGRLLNLQRSPEVAKSLTLLTSVQAGDEWAICPPAQAMM